MNERRIEKYMGLLEMGYSDPTADLHVEGVCVDFDRFLADLESVAGTTDDKCEEFPTEAYHAHMKRKFHVRCEAGENLEITSKSYLSL